MSSLSGTALEINSYIFCIAGGIGIVICMSLCLIYTLQVLKSLSNQDTIKQTDKLTWMLSMCTIIFFTFNESVGVLFYFTCDLTMAELTITSYGPAKCCMYLLFLLRLHLVYNASVYAYNVHLLKSCAVMLIICHICLSWYGYSTVGFQPQEKPNVFLSRSCQIQFGVGYSVLAAGLDVMCTVVSLIAFIVPLRQIIRSLIEKYTKNLNLRDLQYPVKVTILSSIASITTLGGYVMFLLTGTNTAFAVDIPINVLCVVLLSNDNHRAYQVLCCGLIKCVHSCTTKKSSSARDVDELAMQQQTSERNQHHESTVYDTRTLGVSPKEIEIESPSELTETRVPV